ncbi:MAG: hypothetical protein WD071_03175 [Pseudohongiella sp.]|uniref:hypothetical protein n=1 Tax=Pseudohongiella sp. TaxID=1979412 RepID=UPI0034A01B02
MSLNVTDTATTEQSYELILALETLPNELLAAGSASTTTEPGNTRTNNLEVTQRQLKTALTEIRDRQILDQSDSALSDLDELIQRYDEMSHAEKRDLLTAYATHFLRNAQHDDARYFYEQILQLPGLEHTNRLAILQMLARIAMASEDWEGFMVYNDQYFESGGGYNWVVTGHLIRAFSQLENFDAAGEAFLLHFETGIHPEYDGSDVQYQRLYGNIDSIPLDMSDAANALLLAQKMTEQFDQPENWRVLAELYNMTGDVNNYEQTLASARTRDLIDSAGNWVHELANQ